MLKNTKQTNDSKSVKCPKCQSDAVKNGKDSGKQRYRCKEEKCRCNFRKPLPKTLYNENKKRKCMIMYLSGASVREICNVLSSVKEQTIRRWIKKYGSSLEAIVSEKKCVFQELAVIDGRLFKKKKNNIFENDIYEMKAGLVIMEKSNRTIISPLDKDYSFFHNWEIFVKKR